MFPQDSPRWTFITGLLLKRYIKKSLNMIWNQYDIILSFSCFVLCCFQSDNTITFTVTSAEILLPLEQQRMLCSRMLLPQSQITKVSHLNICTFWFILVLAGLCCIFFSESCTILCLKNCTDLNQRI